MAWHNNGDWQNLSIDPHLITIIKEMCWAINERELQVFLAHPVSAVGGIVEWGSTATIKFGSGFPSIGRPIGTTMRIRYFGYVGSVVEAYTVDAVFIDTLTLQFDVPGGVLPQSMMYNSGAQPLFTFGYTTPWPNANGIYTTFPEESHFVGYPIDRLSDLLSLFISRIGSIAQYFVKPDDVDDFYTNELLTYVDPPTSINVSGEKLSNDPWLFTALNQYRQMLELLIYPRRDLVPMLHAQDSVYRYVWTNPNAGQAEYQWGALMEQAYSPCEGNAAQVQGAPYWHVATPHLKVAAAAFLADGPRIEPFFQTPWICVYRTQIRFLNVLAEGEFQSGKWEFYNRSNGAPVYGLPDGGQLAIGPLIGDPASVIHVNTGQETITLDAEYEYPYWFPIVFDDKPASFWEEWANDVTFSILPEQNVFWPFSDGVEDWHGRGAGGFVRTKSRILTLGDSYCVKRLRVGAELTYG